MNRYSFSILPNSLGETFIKIVDTNNGAIYRGFLGVNDALITISRDGYTKTIEFQNLIQQLSGDLDLLADLIVSAYGAPK